MIKKLTALVLIILTAVSCTVAAFAAEDIQRVYDKAGLFSEEERADLEKELNDTVDEIGMDFIILTTSDKEGASLRDYADDFYDAGGFGTGERLSGLLLLLDMEDRTVYISTCGDAINYLTDYRIENLTDGNDELYAFMADGQYKAAAENCIEGVRNYVNEGIVEVQYTVEEKTRKLTVFEILLALGIPGLIAYLYISNVKRQYAMTAAKTHAIESKLAYRAASSFAFAVMADELLNHNVTYKPIVRASSGSGGSWGSGGDSGRSTTHTSSSGTTHGGGGGGRHF